MKHQSINRRGNLSSFSNHSRDWNFNVRVEKLLFSDHAEGKLKDARNKLQVFKTKVEEIVKETSLNTRASGMESQLQQLLTQGGEALKKAILTQKQAEGNIMS